MKPEGSLPCSQELATGPYPEYTSSHPIYLRPILILSFFLRLEFPSGFFASDFVTTILYAFLNSPTYATCLFRPIFLYMVTLIKFGEEYKL
jgi:hypothetical protein